MIVTEAQAQKLWCPFARELAEVRAASDHVVACNRDCFGHPMSLCIASRCMMWRFNGYRGVPFSAIEGQDEAHGFCGLAYSVRLP